MITIDSATNVIGVNSDGINVSSGSRGSSALNSSHSFARMTRILVRCHDPEIMIAMRRSGEWVRILGWPMVDESPYLGFWPVVDCELPPQLSACCELISYMYRSCNDNQITGVLSRIRAARIAGYEHFLQVITGIARHGPNHAAGVVVSGNSSTEDINRAISIPSVLIDPTDNREFRFLEWEPRVRLGEQLTIDAELTVRVMYEPESLPVNVSGIEDITQEPNSPERNIRVASQQECYQPVPMAPVIQQAPPHTIQEAEVTDVRGVPESESEPF